MKKTALSLCSLLMLLFTPAQSFAETSRANVQVTRVSLTASGSSLLVQTSPRPFLDGSCTSDFWLILPISSTNYESLLAMLLTAQSRASKATVFAQDVGNAECNLSRLVLDE